VASEPQLPSADDILRMLMEAEANGGKFFRAVDQETLVGGKRVAKQKVPKLPESAATTIHQVKVTLYGSKPPIWRRLELPSTMTLGRLHHVLQAAFTWDGYHLHVFETACGEFGDPLQDDGWAERQDEETVTIAQVAAALRPCASREFVEAATWVPVPPSVTPAEPDYDDRLERTLRKAFEGYDLDLRALLQQTRSTRPDHCREHRLSCAALLRVIRPNAEALEVGPPRATIVLFDDLLTTGKHYRCCEQRLRELWPRVPVCGWFIARRALRLYSSARPAQGSGIMKNAASLLP